MGCKTTDPDLEKTAERIRRRRDIFGSIPPGPLGEIRNPWLDALHGEPSSPDGEKWLAFAAEVFGDAARGEDEG